MTSFSSWNRFFPLMAGLAVALCLAAQPAHAKKHGGDDTSDRGGLYQPPAPIAKPSLVIESSSPKVTNRKGDAVRQATTDAAAAPPADVADSVVPAPRHLPDDGLVPVRAYEPTRTIESMRLPSLFE